MDLDDRALIFRSEFLLESSIFGIDIRGGGSDENLFGFIVCVAVFIVHGTSCIAI